MTVAPAAIVNFTSNIIHLYLYASLLHCLVEIYRSHLAFEVALPAWLICLMGSMSQMAIPTTGARKLVHNFRVINP
jgi:hypothetical protein